MTACPVAGPGCPDSSHGHQSEPCARCGCGRSTHHEVRLVDGSTALRCRGHHLSGGHSGMVQQCGCPGFEARTADARFGVAVGPAT